MEMEVWNREKIRPGTIDRGFIAFQIETLWTDFKECDAEVILFKRIYNPYNILYPERSNSGLTEGRYSDVEAMRAPLRNAATEVTKETKSQSHEDL
jgi:hypothetical protein